MIYGHLLITTLYLERFVPIFLLSVANRKVNCYSSMEAETCFGSPNEKEALKPKWANDLECGKMTSEDESKFNLRGSGGLLSAKMRKGEISSWICHGHC
ncbi:hypothetical protein AVEN_256271-1 [Araneus ventricosus]|uniref:Uncharacterized protein n=1 Tax=Araneus ventricosus TaxID=182803 RepID=A0A4Y2UJ14_ARAVE|nr:hypothetical protein AVEN_217937-1 [Araneus ventricosus]GBO11578.1 hypothetical protein AVEN_256271-1 [Araneus ventricosus]